MLRLHGDRQSLMAALMAHWADQQLGLSPATTAAPPQVCHTSEHQRHPREQRPTA